MDREVHELGRNFNNVKTDDVLVFPNMLTCVALIAPLGDRLVGAHMTSEEDPVALGQEMRRLAAGAHEFYLVGPLNSGHVEWGPYIRKLGLRNIRRYDTTYSQRFIDVRATANGGDVIFEQKPHEDPDSAYQRIPPSHFSCAIQ